ncbi:hypothetical protein AAHA92_23351 [Salvia divinorum]|uniref:Disease resistance R13L4/SHOC-2-like LRR domain-containing protein n=1 Tax=Salvia divinorum TaxID=28513 RepID=A0ABD1GRR5_SALDI
MAYEAVDSLQQYLRVILQCHDDLTTPQVKQRIISIHDKAVVLQFNLKRFPQQETIKEVATATEGIIQYLFSPEYLSNCKSTDQSVGLSDQLGKLAKVLESTVEYVVDRCKSNDVRKPSGSPSSSSRSPTELIVRDSNWLGRLWGIIKSAPSDSPSMHPPTATSKYVVVGAVPTNKDVVVGLDEDMIQMRCRLIGHDGLKVLPIVGMAGIDEGYLERQFEFKWKELVAERYLNDLTGQSLVLVTSRNIDGKIKSCRLHSTVRGFCVRQAGEEKNDHSYWELGQVFELIYLTYLASNIPDSIVPPAIAKLQNLQTLIIYRYGVHLPVEIWSLRQLRHLIAFSFHPLLLPEGVTLSLNSLQTLSVATNYVCSERMVDMIPNIKKMGICYFEEKFDTGYHLGNLKQLHQLKKLKLEMHGSSMQHSSFVPRLSPVLPLVLKKLELSGRWISWREMTIVGSLPNLQVLKLKNYACHGEHWETIGGEFRKLMLLLIDESDLNHWKTRSSHFPRLKCLMLHRCPYLDEIPHDIGNITTLELIEIDDSNPSLLYSANIIQQMHRKVTRDDSLKVVVKRS